MNNKRQSKLTVAATTKSARPKSCPNPEMSSTTLGSHKLKSQPIKSASSGYDSSHNSSSNNSSRRSLTDKSDRMDGAYLDRFQDSSEESDSDESGIFGNDSGKGWHGNTEDQQKLSATKKFKMEVMKRILEEFDLEKTLEYYRNLSVADMSQNSYDPKDYSPECAHQAEVLRQRMISLMGTDQMNANHREFTTSLREHMRLEYEAELVRAEKARADMERKRMHRLMKEGAITYEDIKGDPIFLKEWQKTKLKYSRTTPKRSRDASSTKPKRAQTAPVSDSSKDNGTASANTSLQTKPAQNPPPSARNKQPERPRTVQWQNRKDRTRYKEEKDEEDDDVDYTRWSSYNKYNDPWILKLQDEESVKGLYTIAEDLLEGKLPSQMGKSEPKKKMVTS